MDLNVLKAKVVKANDIGCVAYSADVTFSDILKIELVIEAEIQETD